VRVRQTVAVTSQALEDYLATIDDADVPTLRELDAAITAAHPPLDVAIKYRLLMYTLGGDWRHWICSINVQRSGACLRFLYGVLLDDPLGVLRKGSAQLMTWDLPRGGAVDADAVGDYVRDAVSRHAYYLEHAVEINATSKATRADPLPDPSRSRGRRRVRDVGP
jgi:hypothetical protein